MFILSVVNRPLNVFISHGRLFWHKATRSERTVLLSLFVFHWLLLCVWNFHNHVKLYICLSFNLTTISILQSLCCMHRVSLYSQLLLLYHYSVGLCLRKRERERERERETSGGKWSVVWFVVVFQAMVLLYSYYCCSAIHIHMMRFNCHDAIISIMRMQDIAKSFVKVVLDCNSHWQCDDEFVT
jgi:hypothetical protein